MSSLAQYKRADGSYPYLLPDGRAQFYDFNSGRIVFQFPPGHTQCPPYFAAACSAAVPDFVRMKPPPAQEESQRPASNQMQQHAESQYKKSATTANPAVPIEDTRRMEDLGRKLTGRPRATQFQPAESPESAPCTRSIGNGRQFGPSAYQSQFSSVYSSGYGNPDPFVLRPEYVPVDEEDYNFMKEYPREQWPGMLSDWKGVYAQCLAKQKAADAKRESEKSAAPVVATQTKFDKLLTCDDSDEESTTSVKEGGHRRVVRRRRSEDVAC